MLISRRTNAVALAVVVLLVSGGCSKLREIESAATGNISQWTADKLTQAFSAINAKIGANPADYKYVLIDDHSVNVEAIDPHKPENVDKYTYLGGIVEVKPVDPSHEVDSGSYKGDVVNPAGVAQAIGSAPKDSGVENPSIEWVKVTKLRANDNAPQIWVEVHGPRGSKMPIYDLKGGFQYVGMG